MEKKFEEKGTILKGFWAFEAFILLKLWIWDGYTIGFAIISCKCDTWSVVLPWDTIKMHLGHIWLVQSSLAMVANGV